MKLWVSSPRYLRDVERINLIGNQVRNVVKSLILKTILVYSVHVLTVFYCDKLDDTDTIIPALKGLAPLTSNTSFTSDDAVTSIKAWVLVMIWVRYLILNLFCQNFPACCYESSRAIHAFLGLHRR